MTAQLFAMTPRMCLDLARAQKMAAPALIQENVMLKKELRDVAEALQTVSEAYARIRGREIEQ